MNISLTIFKIITSRNIFWLFSVLFISYVFFGLIFIEKVGGYDYWEHLAAIHSYYLNILHPENPYILTQSPTHLFTPYHFFWGGISKIINIHPYILLPVIGLCNIILYIYAANKFCQHVIGDCKYTVLMILTMLFFWFDPWGWSGFYDFSLLPVTAVYPYWFAMPLAMLVVALYSEERDSTFFILLIPVFSIVFLIHPLTGSFLIITTSVKIVLFKNKTRKQKTKILVTLPIALLLSFLWPYYPVLDTIINSSKFVSLGFAGDYMAFYKPFFYKTFPALFGMIFIYTFIKKQDYFIVLCLFVFSSIYLLNYCMLHSFTIARYVIYVVFFLHILIVMGMKEYYGKKEFKFFVVSYFSILVVLAPFHIHDSLKQIDNVVRAVIHKKPIIEQLNVDTFNRFIRMGDYIKSEDVVMASMEDSWKIPAILGCKVVGVLHSNPFMSDFFLRQKKTELFFNKNTSNKTRVKILENYKVSYILLSKKTDNRDLTVIENTDYVYQDDKYILMKFNQSRHKV